MKGKILLMVAASLLLASAPAAIAKTATWQYPKWYYYDQLGLQLWNKGEKRKALEQFKYAKQMAESSTRIPPGGFDARTKKIFNDLFHHNMLVLTVEDEGVLKVGANIADYKQRMTAEIEERNRQLDRKITFMETMKKFAERFIGKKSYLAVDMDKRIAGIHQIQKQNDTYLKRILTDNTTLTNMPVDESRRVDGNIGVPIPKWYRSTSSRFGDAGHEKERKTNEVYDRNIGYKNGQRVELGRDNKDTTNGWGVGMGHTDTVGTRNPGWGSNSTPQKHNQLWGQERDDADPTKKRAPKGWGETNTPKETAGSGWGSGSNWGEPVQEGASPNATPATGN